MSRIIDTAETVGMSLVTTVAAFLCVDVPTAFFVMLGLGALHSEYHQVPAMGFVWVLLSLIVLSLVYHGATYKIET